MAHATVGEMTARLTSLDVAAPDNVDALRVLCLDGPTAGPVLKALAWTAGLLAVAVPATVNRYRPVAN